MYEDDSYGGVDDEAYYGHEYTTEDLIDLLGEMLGNSHSEYNRHILSSVISRLEVQSSEISELQDKISHIEGEVDHIFERI